MTMLPTTPAEMRADLREWRLRHGLSQRALGEELGVTRLTVARWELGTRAMPAFLYLTLRELERQLEAEPVAPLASALGFS
jgi:transcriptional regulator with XRE-family HTH domain